CLESGATRTPGQPASEPTIRDGPTIKGEGMLRRIVGMLAAVLVASTGAAVPASAHPHRPGGSAPVVDNPGFEADGTTQTPDGWREKGNRAASFVEAGGQGGTGFRLS